jgi:hypothetical protein
VSYYICVENKWTKSKEGKKIKWLKIKSGYQSHGKENYCEIYIADKSLGGWVREKRLCQQGLQLMAQPWGRGCDTHRDLTLRLLPSVLPQGVLQPHAGLRRLFLQASFCVPIGKDGWSIKKRSKMSPRPNRTLSYGHPWLREGWDMLSGWAYCHPNTSGFY